MQIKRKAFTFHNLLYMTKVCAPDDWYTVAQALRDVVIIRGLYLNAPIIYTSTPTTDDQNEYTVYVPVNVELSVKPDMPFQFMKELYLDDTFVFRLADLDEPGEAEAYLLLDTAAEAQGCTLKRPFYNVVLNVFDDVMLDIVAPIAPADNPEGN